MPDAPACAAGAREQRSGQAKRVPVGRIHRHVKALRPQLPKQAPKSQRMTRRVSGQCVHLYHARQALNQAPLTRRGEVVNLDLRALVDQRPDQRAGDDLVADAPIRPDNQKPPNGLLEPSTPRRKPSE